MEGAPGRDRPRAPRGATRARGLAIRRLILAAITAATIVCAPAAAHMSHREYLAYVHCEQGHVLSCIHRAAIHRNVDYGTALSVAWRESRYQPGICNKKAIWDGEHACGLFQFIPSTWRTTPYAARSIFSAKWSAMAYAWMVTHGRAGEFASP